LRTVSQNFDEFAKLSLMAQTETAYYRTGQAAKVLGLSSYQLRRLAECGLIDADFTGNQWRISSREVERLHKEGVPEVPAGVDAEQAPEPRPRLAANGFLAPPSNAAVSAVEDVHIAENLLKKRRVELDLLELEDKFQEREIAEAERHAERERAERARLEEDDRTDWLRRAEESGLRRIHPDVPAQMRLTALEAVRTRLEPLTPIPSPQVTAEIINAALELALGPWIRLGDMAAVAAEIREKLPWEFRDSPEVRTAAVEAAVSAMNDLLTGNIHATLRDLKAAATAPVQAVVSTFRHEHRCRKLLNDHWWLRLPDGTAEEQAQAKAAVETALLQQPFTKSDRDMEKARNSALAPFHAAVAQARAEQQTQQQADARQRQDRVNREAVLRSTSWKFPYGMPQEENALAAAREAIEGLPEYTSVRDLEAARDRAIKPYFEKHAERKRKEDQITSGLHEVFPYLLKLEAENRLGSKRAYTLKCELEPKIRKQLEAEMKGQEPPEHVTKLVRRIVREALGVPPRKAYA
jgi:excisionase family DNA binding protein